ncbi:MAG: hypothetical protein M1136_00930 [Chloroflexi bacterium]|nr:hypothetical protein [Chloroflexota bacterium]
MRDTMGKTNFDELELVTNLPNTELASPNAEDTITFYVAGAQTVGTKKAAALIGKAATITDVRAYLDTAPTGATFIVDVNINGVTAFTTQANRPTIAISGNASTTTLPDVVALAAGDRLTIDVDQIGSTVAGSDLYVTITIKRAHVA